LFPLRQFISLSLSLSFIMKKMWFSVVILEISILYYLSDFSVCLKKCIFLYSEWSHVECKEMDVHNSYQTMKKWSLARKIILATFIGMKKWTWGESCLESARSYGRFSYLQFCSKNTKSRSSNLPSPSTLYAPLIRVICN